MFEAGKKYIYTYNNSIYECLYVGKEKSFLRNTNTNLDIREVCRRWNSYWKEYKEPQKIVLYLGFYISLKDRLYTTNRLFINKENIPLTNDGDPLNGIHEIVYEEKLK